MQSICEHERPAFTASTKDPGLDQMAELCLVVVGNFRYFYIWKDSKNHNTESLYKTIFSHS